MKPTSLNCALILFVAAGAAMAEGRLRVVHASPDAPAVDIYVDGAKVLESLPYKEYSEYLPVPAGIHAIRVNVTGTQTTVFQASPTIQDGQDFTAVAVGFAAKAPSLDVLLLADDNSQPSRGGIKVRAIHAAPSAPSVDIYITTPFETLDGKNPVLANVPFKAASGYLEVPPRLYQARIAAAGTKTIALDSHRLPTWTGMVRTLIAVDAKGGGAPFDLIILPDSN